EGRPLFDAALVRCVRAAAATTIAVVIGALPLAMLDGGGAMVVRHAAFAGVLGVAAALLIPAVTIGAAALVVQGGAERALRAATTLGGAPPRPSASGGPRAGGGAQTGGGAQGSPSAVLGELPGFAATFVIAAMLFIASWLVG